MPRGKNTSRIGKREEKQIVKDLESLGWKARKQPGSGNRDITLQDDVVWFESRARPHGEIHIEDKFREKCVWKSLLNLKGGADILTLRQARGERMAFLSWSLLLELVGPTDEAAMQSFEQAMMKAREQSQTVTKHRPKRPWPKGRKLPSRSFQKAGK